MFIDFRERGKGGEKNIGMKRNISWFEKHPPICALTWDQTHNLGMCPDQGSNLQPFGVRDDAPAN